jgi:hypothetical protein
MTRTISFTLNASRSALAARITRAAPLSIPCWLSSIPDVARVPGGPDDELSVPDIVDRPYEFASVNRRPVTCSLMRIAHYSSLLSLFFLELSERIFPDSAAPSPV